MTDRDHDETEAPPDFENLFLRLIHVVIIGVMMSMAQTLLNVLTVAQYIIMLVSKRQPNEQLAQFGDTMGVWMAKAARFQTGASEVKPWPWTELD